MENYSKYTVLSKLWPKWVQDKKVRVKEWPSQSPDNIFFKIVWAELKRKCEQGGLQT